jgi:hypothetical protein
MRLRLTVAAALSVAVVPAVAAGGITSMSPVVSAKLTGKSEVPAASATGSGIVTLHLSGSKGTVCWRFAKVKGIGTPQAAHIHKGKAGTSGAVVVPLGAAYKAKGCTKASKSTIGAIEEHPNSYYVNVHTKKYPNGAIRGQLVAGMIGG